jgi:hypothetical protein
MTPTLPHLHYLATLIAHLLSHSLLSLSHIVTHWLSCF